MRERIARQPPLKLGVGRKKGEGEMAGERGKGERGRDGDGEWRRRRSSLGNWLSRKRGN